MSVGEATVAAAPDGVKLAAQAAALELTGVTKRYGEVLAVDDVDLQIAPGEFFAMLGPSGCGKSTTLRAMAGFESLDAGKIYLGGVDVTDDPPFRRDVNLVFQDYALFPHLNLRDNVAFSLKIKRVGRRERHRRADEMLERVALPGLGDRRIKEVSGGQQQRVALARALINQPKVLLLDEPLGALDLKLRKTMQLELKAIQRDAGISFVYVTHDQEEALAMADRIAVMSAGKTLQIAPPKEIYDFPADRFVADFIGESSFLTGAPETGGDGDLVRFRLRSGERILARPGLAPRADSVAMVRPEHLELVAKDSEPATPAESLNRIDATVTELEYGGSDVHYFLTTAGGEHLMSRMPASQEMFTPGTAVIACFPVEKTVLVQAGAGSAGQQQPTTDQQPKKGSRA
ncbi:MAG TPA: ABC transporter ATP-binding protein [Solirubrobacteraceae bacterium]|nr:ABC transporter ATP-binding protein [Solirubrobacteraceae bacterium]